MAEFVDAADWTGVPMISIIVTKPGRHSAQFLFKGVEYVTPGEYDMARLLTRLKIPFTPNVKFTLKGQGENKVIYVPDFIFNGKAYVWEEDRLIHGIEAKGLFGGSDFTQKARRKVRLLREQRGINVLLLSDETIRQYFLKRKLPMRPLIGP